MPRVISDELYEKLIAPIPEGRLLGVMGLLERVQAEAIDTNDPGSCEDCGYPFKWCGEQEVGRYNPRAFRVCTNCNNAW